MYTSRVANGLRFEWDRANIAHIARHHVKPDEAEEALRHDPMDVDYGFIEGEHRWTIVGHTTELRILTVVWTMRSGDVIRVVTARDSGRVARLAYLRYRGLLI